MPGKHWSGSGSMNLKTAVLLRLLAWNFVILLFFWCTKNQNMPLSFGVIFFLKKNLFLIMLCMRVCVWGGQGYVHLRWPWRPEESLGPSVGVTGAYEPPPMGAGNQTVHYKNSMWSQSLSHLSSFYFLLTRGYAT